VLAGLRDGIEAAVDLLDELDIRSIFASAHSDPETSGRARLAGYRSLTCRPP
jgi:hypothetical protein